MPDYFDCPHCGAPVPIDAEACPQCGSDEETGWSEYAEVPQLRPYADKPEARTPTYGEWLKYALVFLAVSIPLALLVGRFPWALYVVFALLVVGIAYVVARALAKTRDGAQTRLYEKLLLMARGDKDLVERLVEHERQRNLHLKRAELLQRAIDHWEHDLR